MILICMHFSFQTDVSFQLRRRSTILLRLNSFATFANNFPKLLPANAILSERRLLATPQTFIAFLIVMLAYFKFFVNYLKV